MTAPRIKLGKGIEGVDLGKTKTEVLSLLRSIIRSDPSADEINAEVLATELGAVFGFDAQDRLRVIGLEHPETSPC